MTWLKLRVEVINNALYLVLRESVKKRRVFFRMFRVIYSQLSNHWFDVVALLLSRILLVLEAWWITMNLIALVNSMFIVTTVRTYWSWWFRSVVALIEAGTSSVKAT